MPTPNLYINSTEDPFANVPEEFRNNRVDVLYATDRQNVTEDHGSIEYSYHRSFSLAFGSAIVEIGDDVSWEDLVKDSRSRKRSMSLPVSLEQIIEKGRFPETPIPLSHSEGGLVADPILEAYGEEVAENLRQEIRERLARTAKKEAYLFVHGYNNSFEDAAIVIAELWHFLGRQGIPIVYAWPAGIGGIRGYFYDRESGEFTIYHLKQFLRILGSCDELKKVHIIAHSRGTDVATNALRELFLESKKELMRDINQKTRKKPLKFGNLVLAAPDLDLEVLSQRIAAERFLRYADRVTLYVSREDRAIMTCPNQRYQSLL